MNKKFNLICIFLFSSFLMLTGCNKEEASIDDLNVTVERVTEGSFKAPLPAAEGLGDLLNEIRLTAGMAYAQNPASCKVAEVGIKPCGGPERYLLYSTEVADEQALLQMISRYNAASAALNHENQLVSDCQILPRPQIVLNNGVCVPTIAKLK